MRGLLVMLLIGGCRTMVLDGNPDGGAVRGVACGATVCPVGQYCVLCPTDGGAARPVCGPRPANAPDFWTTGHLCSPNWPTGRDAPTLSCDGSEDCDGGRACVTEANYAHAYCGTAVAACAAKPASLPLCRTIADCPRCATGCVARTDLPVSVCRW